MCKSPRGIDIVHCKKVTKDINKNSSSLITLSGYSNIQKKNTRNKKDNSVRRRRRKKSNEEALWLRQERLKSNVKLYKNESKLKIGEQWAFFDQIT